jgi:predicted  nucleic acid-binding Zn-ribbon protein
MADDLVLERVKKLEKAFASLATLPREVADLTGEAADLKRRVGSLEVQIVQLRAEMTEEFSAVRVDLRSLHEKLASTRSDILEVIESSSQATGELFREVWSQVRMLHEDVIERIKHLGDRPS